MPYVPVENIKRDMLAMGYTEEEFTNLGIEDGIYPSIHGRHTEMTVYIK
jgi:hypothetical protein